jgi:hypothetical protein
MKAAELAPASVADLLCLLETMPNPGDTDRDVYVAGLAVQGCIRGGRATGTISEDGVPDIWDAAAEWAARWEYAARALTTS